MLSKGSVAVLPVLLLGIVWWLRVRFDDGGTCCGPRRFSWLPWSDRSEHLVPNTWHGQVDPDRWFLRNGCWGPAAWCGSTLYKALLPLIWLLFIRSGTSKPAIRCGGCRLLAALAVTAVLWRYREGWSRPFLFAWGFFCVALVPVMGFTDVGFMKYSLVADHYQHIAIIGVIALAAAGWSIMAWASAAESPLAGNRRRPGGSGNSYISDLAAKWDLSRPHHTVSGDAGKKSDCFGWPTTTWALPCPTQSNTGGDRTLPAGRSDEARLF